MKIDGKESKYQIGQICQYTMYDKYFVVAPKHAESPILAIYYEGHGCFSYLVYNEDGKQWIHEGQVRII